MDIWLCISIVAMVFTVVMSIVGAKKSSEGVIGVIAHLSIAAFMIAVIAAFAMPQYPGFAWQEMVILAVVLGIGVLTAWSNNKHNDIIMKKLKEHSPRWKH